MNRRIKLRETYGQPPQRKNTATALQYMPGQDLAPRVVATGQGKMAEQILALAKENGVPIYDDPDLALALSAVRLDEEIPPELYLVVAEVLAYLYRVANTERQ